MRKDFQMNTAVRYSTFITSQSMFVLRNMCWKET